MLRIAAPTVILAALLLAGCASPAPAPIETQAAETPAAQTPAEPSAECTASLVAVGATEAGDFDAEDAAILASLSACADADEYLAAVKANPESWLYTDADKVDPALMFLSACMIDGAAETPVCVDAKADGYLDE